MNKSTICTCRRWQAQSSKQSVIFVKCFYVETSLSSPFSIFFFQRSWKLLLVLGQQIQKSPLFWRTAQARGRYSEPAFLKEALILPFCWYTCCFLKVCLIKRSLFHLYRFQKYVLLQETAKKGGWIRNKITVCLAKTFFFTNQSGCLEGHQHFSVWLKRSLHTKTRIWKRKRQREKQSHKIALTLTESPFRASQKKRRLESALLLTSQVLGG